LLLPTPSATSYGTNCGGQNPEGPERPSLDTMARKGPLPTPTAADSVGVRNRTSSRPLDSKHHDGVTLTDALWMGMLPTPTQRDWRSAEASDETLNRNARPLNEVVISRTGSDGPMRLNPQFVAWMMGFPPGWLDVECPRSERSATPSSRRSRLNYSEPSRA
jgi:hypothetical protein